MIGDIAAAIFVVTIIYVMVRPRSKGAETVKIITDTFASLVSVATREE